MRKTKNEKLLFDYIKQYSFFSEIDKDLYYWNYVLKDDSKHFAYLQYRDKYNKYIIAIYLTDDKETLNISLAENTIKRKKGHDGRDYFFRVDTKDIEKDYKNFNNFIQSFKKIENDTLKLVVIENY